MKKLLLFISSLTFGIDALAQYGYSYNGRFIELYAQQDSSYYVETNQEMDLKGDLGSQLSLKGDCRYIIKSLDSTKSYSYKSEKFTDMRGNGCYILPKLAIKVRDGYSIESLISRYAKVLKYDRTLKNNKISLFSVDLHDAKSVLILANNISKEDYIEWCEPDMIADWTQCNVFYSQQYYLKNTNWGQKDINIESAWALQTGNSDIVVAVIDNGVESNHEDLQDCILQGYTCGYSMEYGNPKNANEADPKSHGTCCAGIIGAVNNNIGVRGVASGVSILPVNIAPYSAYGNYHGFASNSEIADAISWAAERADILSCSWGGGLENTMITQAIFNARTFGRNGKGCIVVFAAGNSYPSQISFPASLEGVVTVGATDKYGNITNYSQHGDALNLVAFGGYSDIVTTDRMGSLGSNSNGSNNLSNTNYTNRFSGTSAACPQVAGVAALMLSANPYLTENQIKGILENTARDLGDSGWDSTYGYGLIDAGCAVDASIPKIVGPGMFRDSATYTISPSLHNMRVEWSKRSISQTINIFADNPSTNCCKAKQLPATPGSIWLDANIYINDSCIYSLSRKIQTVPYSTGYYSQEACTFHGIAHPAISQRLLRDGYPHFVHQGCVVSLYSNYIQPEGEGPTITWEGPTPDNWLIDRDNHTLLFSMPLGSGGIPFYVKFEDLKSLLFFSASNNGNVTNLAVIPCVDGYELSLATHPEVLGYNQEATPRKEDEQDIHWLVEIFSTESSKTIFCGESYGRTFLLNSKNWKSGLYIAKITANDDTYIIKLRID